MPAPTGPGEGGADDAPGPSSGVRLAAWGVGVLLSLALAEGVLRLAGIGWPVFARPDGRYGQVLIPGAKGRYRTEGSGWVSINADGMRDVAHTREKPAGTWRIAVLGDSYAEALQVDREQAFWAVMGARLGSCGALRGSRVEVLNFGVSGYDQAQELLVLREKVMAYRPDAVLLAVLTGNDIADNVPALAQGRRPYFHRGPGGVLTLDTSQARSPGVLKLATLSLVRHLRVLQVVNAAWLRLTMGAAATGPGESGLRNGVYLPPSDTAWASAWTVTESLLHAIRDEVAAHSAALYVVTLSNGIQVHPDPLVRERFRRAIGSPDLLYPDRRMAQVAADARVPFLMLAPRLQAWAESTGRPLHGWPGPGQGTGHWNAEGHRVAGEAIAAWMCQAAGTTP